MDRFFPHRRAGTALLRHPGWLAPALAPALALALAAGGFAAEGLFPFVPPWDDASPSVTALGHRLEKPAGAKGFVSAKDGRLFAGDRRIRFFGVNLCFGACFPSQADADKIAARMAKFGIGCVRFHHMDTEPAPNGLLQRDKRTLDPAMLDRLDTFVAALKKHGIYTNLNLHVGLVYPGMRTWNGMPLFGKGVDQFYPPLIEFQKNYARQLLTHVNPHTGLSYAEEPAVAFVEINNENSLINEWWRGALDAMPDPYLGELRGRWNRWLAATYTTPEALDAVLNEGLEPLGWDLLEQRDPGRRWAAWKLEQHGQAMSLLGRELIPNASDAWHVRVDRPGSEDWHIQINQGGLKLAGGRPYTFSFRMRADKPRRINVAVAQAHPPWLPLWNTVLNVTPDWHDYRLVFTLAEGDGNARIGFADLGDRPGGFSFRDPSLRPGNRPAKRVTSPAGFDILRKRDFAGNSPGLQTAWTRFLWEEERGYWREMARYLKTDLKVGSLLIGTQVGYSPFPIQAELDVVDSHGYWQHPEFPKGKWNLENWTVRNLPMAGTPDGGALASLAMGRVAGKPFICTEYNHASPNTFSAEAFPLLAAYAALQDWDAIFAFAYSHRRDDWDAKRFPNFFDIDQHPVKMVSLPAAVALFCRGDVRSPEARTVANGTQEQAIEHVRRFGPEAIAASFGATRRDFLSRPFAASIDGAPRKKAEPPLTVGQCVVSDNRELTWDSENPRVVTIDTERSKGVIGFCVGRGFRLGEIVIVPSRALQGWASVLVTELDSKEAEAPDRSKRFLVTATGYSENTGMGWKNKERSTVSNDWGNAPALVEGIGAKIRFLKPGTLRAWALDERGGRKTELPVGGDSVQIGPEYETLWYEVEWAAATP